MSIRGLRAVKAVVEHASFANGARALNLTSSAISMQISALEDALGARLFDRSHRPPRLTRAGEVVVRYAKSIVDQYDRMVMEAGTKTAHREYFRLGVIPTALMTSIPRTLIKLKRNHPNLVVSVTSSLSGHLQQMVDIGELDGALMHKPEQLDTRFVWRDVYEQTVVVLAPPGSTESEIGELLTKYPYIRFNRSAWIAPLIEARLSKLGFDPQAMAEVDSLEAIQKMVEMGMGIAIVPDDPNAAHSHSCRRVDFGSPPLRRRIGLLARQSGPRKRTREVIADALVYAFLGQTE